ncbi:MAG: orotidine-5'-phosphate decarboxylase [Oscillospiraceae bacterium]|jgi:orotidine-5'-phosphate decarboxylase|nr:orotidine-5'-phosphate decarboxylase [Oscillospiraceae bacterium]
MSFSQLQSRIDALGSPIVVGLDPTEALIPPHLLLSHSFNADTVAQFCCEIIDAVSDIVPAVKPQSAFFERLGIDGVRALYYISEYAHSRGLYVILDAKRGDIGSTAQAYADAYLGAYAPFDALTVNGYLGSDGILPFFTTARTYGKGVFVLVKTSNPSSGELQDLDVGGRTVYEAVADIISDISGGDTLGAVVGATYPETLESLRRRLGDAMFLIPGYGAQGGGAGDVARGFDTSGRSAIVNSSRAILGAWQSSNADSRDFAATARLETLRMRDELRNALGL